MPVSGHGVTRLVMASILLCFLLLLSRDNMMERTKQIQLFCIFPCFCQICKSFSATHSLVFRALDIIYNLILMMEVAYPDLVGHTGSTGVHKCGLKPT